MDESLISKIVGQTKFSTIDQKTTKKQQKLNPLNLLDEMAKYEIQDSRKQVFFQIQERKVAMITSQNSFQYLTEMETKITHDHDLS